MAHGQTDALPHDGALQEDGIPFVPHLARQDLIGQLIYAAVVAALVGQLCHLCKNPLANVRNSAVYVSHGRTFLVFRVIVLQHYTIVGRFAQGSACKFTYQLYNKLSCLTPNHL